MNVALTVNFKLISFDIFTSNGMSLRKEIRRKSGPLAFCLSWSLKVIETDTDRSATYDFQ